MVFPFSGLPPLPVSLVGLHRIRDFRSLAHSRSPSGALLQSPYSVGCPFPPFALPSLDEDRGKWGVRSSVCLSSSLRTPPRQQTKVLLWAQLGALTSWPAASLWGFGGANMGCEPFTIIPADLQHHLSLRGLLFILYTFSFKILNCYWGVS